MKPLLVLLSCLFWCAIAPSVAQSSEIERARALHKAGKSGQALNVLEPLVDRAGTRYEALLLRGDILIEQGTDAEAALAAYSGAIHVAPDSLAPHLNRGALYLALNMPERAIPDLETALSKSTGTSDSTVVLSNLGNAYTMVRKFDRALTYYDLALQLDSVSWTTLNNKAAVLDDLGRTDEAYSIYLKLHEQKPDELPILNNLGFMSSNQERYADALKWFQKARELAPNDAYILNNLGYVQLKMGDTKAALASVNSSIKAFGSNSYAYRNLALVQIARGDPSAACDALERALALGFTKQYGDEVDRLRKAHCR